MASCVLTSTLARQKKEFDKLAMVKFHHRDDLDMLSAECLIQYLYGVRGAGKTTLALNFVKSSGLKAAYLNIEAAALRAIIQLPMPDLLAQLAQAYGDFNTIIVDEFSKCDDYTSLLNKLVSTGLRIIAINSGEMPDLPSSLDGPRLRIFPLSFSEYCVWHGVVCDFCSLEGREKAKQIFDEYIIVGGFPAMQSRKNINAAANRLLNAIIEKDTLAKISKIKQPGVVTLTDKIMHDSPCMLDYKALKDDIKSTSINTLRKYVSLIQASLVMEPLMRLSLFDNVRNYMEQLYAADMAFVDKKQRDNLLMTAVFAQLSRICHQYGYFVHYFSSRDLNCAFAVCRDMHMHALFQILTQQHTDREIEQKIAGLKAVSKSAGCNHMCILTDKYIDTSTAERLNVEFLPINEFLYAKYLDFFS